MRLSRSAGKLEDRRRARNVVSAFSALRQSSVARLRTGEAEAAHVSLRDVGHNIRSASAAESISGRFGGAAVGAAAVAAAAGGATAAAKKGSSKRGRRKVQHSWM